MWIVRLLVDYDFPDPNAVAVTPQSNGKITAKVAGSNLRVRAKASSAQSDSSDRRNTLKMQPDLTILMIELENGKWDKRYGVHRERLYMCSSCAIDRDAGGRFTARD